MLSTEEVNKSVLQIVDKKNELSKIGYNNPQYDIVEEELHDLEDEFLDAYGEMLEAALKKVHDAYCPRTEVMLPIAYLAKTYQKDADSQYTAGPEDGVPVELTDGKQTGRLVFLPSPLQLALVVGTKKQKIVWEIKDGLK